MMAMPEKIKQTERQTDGQNQNQTKQETTSALHPQFQLAEVVRAWIVLRQMDDFVTFYNSTICLYLMSSISNDSDYLQLFQDLL